MKLVPDFSWLSGSSHKRILEILTQEGGEGRFVGSAVRESFLRRPIKDFDVATTHLPDHMEVLLKKASLPVISVGKAHGTLTTVLEGCVYEITTLRQDLKTDGRHAEVAFTQDWEIDASRRDFTMNALYVDHLGKVYDFYDGLQDLEEGRVRFIGDPMRRIEEDHLRILRFFRFNAFYGTGDMNQEGLQACIKLKDKMSTLSRERVSQEFLRLLEAPSPWDILEVMQNHQILVLIGGLPTTVLCHARVLSEIKAMKFLETLSGKAPVMTRLKILFREVSEPPPRLNLTRKLRQEWDQLGQKEDPFLTYAPQIASGVLALEEVSLLFQKAQLKQQVFAQTSFPLRGADILAYGFPPGKEVGQLIQQVHVWWVTQDPLPSREACLSYVEELIRSQKKGSAMWPSEEETSK